MRITLAELQRAVLVIHTHGDKAWGRFLDIDALRLRRFLEAFVVLNREAIALKREQVELRRILEEHQLATHVVGRLLKEQRTDAWEDKVARWNDLVRVYYRPWTREACCDEMAAALKEVDTFQSSVNKLSTGLSFFGWRDLQRLDRSRGVFQFQFPKTFRGFDVMDYVNVGWDTYTTAPDYAQVVMGHRAVASHDVLQQIGPNMVIFRTAERFSAISIDVHVIYLVFRIKTERGITQCVRSIHCPEVVHAFGDNLNLWPSNVFWFQWEFEDTIRKEFTLRIGGSMGGTDAAYANLWMPEVFGAVLRAEHLATGQQLIASTLG